MGGGFIWQRKHFVVGKVEMRLKLVSPESFPWEVSQTTWVQVLIALIQRYRKNLPNIACQLSMVITIPYIGTIISVHQVDFVHTNPVVLAAKNSFIRYFVNHLNTVITDIQ